MTNERVLFLPVGSIRLLHGWINPTPNLGVVVLEAQADVNITIFPNDLGSMSWLVIYMRPKSDLKVRSLRFRNERVLFVQGVVSDHFQWMEKSETDW